MGVYEGRGQLSRAMKDLMAHWRETRLYWDDALARNFERNYITPLETNMRNAGGAMDHMAALLNQIRRDCSSDE
jgi:hypothetical protein